MLPDLVLRVAMKKETAGAHAMPASRDARDLQTCGNGTRRPLAKQQVYVDAVCATSEGGCLISSDRPQQSARDGLGFKGDIDGISAAD